MGVLKCPRRGISLPALDSRVAQHSHHLGKSQSEGGMCLLEMFDAFLQLLEHRVWSIIALIVRTVHQPLNFLIEAEQEVAVLFVERFSLCNLISKFFQHFKSFFVCHKKYL